MSRTDAHVPDRVLAARALPWQKSILHHYRCVEATRSFVRPVLRVECDLDSGPFSRCRTWVERPYSPQPYQRQGTAFVSSRARVRDELRAAQLEYNTHGYTDADVVPYDHIWCLCEGCGYDAR